MVVFSQFQPRSTSPRSVFRSLLKCTPVPHETPYIDKRKLVPISVCIDVRHASADFSCVH